MTNFELERLAELVSKNIIQAVKQDGELLDLVCPPRLMDSMEAAEFLKIPVNTLYQLSGEIPHCKVGKRLIFSDRDLTRWIKNV